MWEGGAPLFLPGRLVTRFVTRVGAAPIAVLAALTLTGCALTFDATELGVPTTMSESAVAPAQGTRFRITKHPTFLLWGLVGASRPNVEDVLAGQVGTGARIADLRIKVRSRWGDLLVTALSFGFLAPRTVTFEGVVVPGTATGP